MKNIIKLDPERIDDREKLKTYMREIFGFSQEEIPNLDALYDELSEVSKKTTIKLSRAALRAIILDDFAFTVLKVLTRAADENPHIHLLVSGR